MPERKLGSRDCSPECLRKGYHVSLVPQKPVRPVATADSFIPEMYLARAAQRIVAGLHMADPPQDEPVEKKPEKKTGSVESAAVQIKVNGVATEKVEDVFDDCQEFVLLYDEGGRESAGNDAEDVVPARSERKLRRASSLKSPKSPPSPGEKKIVRFADALGLDLADIRTFLDEVPKVPKSAFNDLEGVEIAPSPVGSFTDPFSMPARNDKSVIPLFQQPFASRNFMEKLRSNSVCLESASVTDPNLFMITGVVRVVNLGFHKEVIVRYSDDSWLTHNDVQARYLPNSCDGFSDKFSFILFANGLEIGKRLELALRYKVNENEFWDNNDNANYTFQCVPIGMPRPAETYEPSPLAFGSSFSGSFF